MSDDGRHGLTIIVFIGSVFSPYYAWARRHAGSGGAEPANHCAFNVALYGAGGKRWCMTERGQGALQRGADFLRVGNSSVAWDGQTLVLDIDEVTVPWPGRCRGQVRVQPPRWLDTDFALHANGRHRWRPLAPAASFEVRMTSPALQWRGSGYVDCNRGEEPLERAFRSWDWSRAHLAGGQSAVLYDVRGHDDSPRSLALHFDRHGDVESFDPPPAAALPATLWRLPRCTRADVGPATTVMRTLEDGPFYSRSLLDTRVLGQQVTAVHESLSLSRFDSRWVQAMLPFRMPRRSGGR